MTKESAASRRIRQRRSKNMRRKKVVELINRIAGQALRDLVCDGVRNVIAEGYKSLFLVSGFVASRVYGNAIRAAHKAGLRVEVLTDESHAVGETWAMPMIEVRVTKDV